MANPRISARIKTSSNFALIPIRVPGIILSELHLTYKLSSNLKGNTIQRSEKNFSNKIEDDIFNFFFKFTIHLRGSHSQLSPLFFGQRSSRGRRIGGGVGDKVGIVGRDLGFGRLPLTAPIRSRVRQPGLRLGRLAGVRQAVVGLRGRVTLRGERKAREMPGERLPLRTL